MSRQDNGSWGVAMFACASAALANFGVLAILQRPVAEPCQCKPTPTPAPCCKADECRKELAQVDARFGDVWDELVEVQEQLAKAKPCACPPSKPCACSDKPACECSPAPPQPKVLLPTYRKRCR